MPSWLLPAASGAVSGPSPPQPVRTATETADGSKTRGSDRRAGALVWRKVVTRRVGDGPALGPQENVSGYRETTVADSMTTGVSGTSLKPARLTTAEASIRSTVSIPEITRPKTA